MLLAAKAPTNIVVMPSEIYMWVGRTFGGIEAEVQFREKIKADVATPAFLIVGEPAFAAFGAPGDEGDLLDAHRRESKNSGQNET